MNNVSLTKVWSLLTSMHGSSQSTPFRKQDIRSMCASIARDTIHGDMQKTISVFSEMRKCDPSVVYEVDVDSDGRMRSIFWCTGHSKVRYASFGDVVTFDTTYRTNLYNMPFGLFVGVNNNFQSCIFGGVFFREETIDAFKWAFSVFIKTMGSKLPNTILTGKRN